MTGGTTGTLQSGGPGPKGPELAELPPDPAAATAAGVGSQGRGSLPGRCRLESESESESGRRRRAGGLPSGLPARAGPRQLPRLRCWPGPRPAHARRPLGFRRSGPGAEVTVGPWHDS